MLESAGPILGVFGGCMGCMVVVENIAKQQPSSMNLMTFSSFLFIAVHGLIFTSKFFSVPNKIPLRGYIPTVVMFFTVNIINNQALNFHVPVPLHIIFRSGSLLANLVLDVCMGKRYSTRKYMSVFTITIGIIICTLATNNSADDYQLSVDEASKHYKEWAIGIAMLTFALIASAYLAICQQKMYETYGKHPEEAMFITHLVSLPFFLPLWNDISRAAMNFSASFPYHIPLFGDLPNLWVNLALNCFLQYLCIRFVYSLNATCSALTVTLIVTLRKFFSLVVSIFYFNNPFTAQHWLGAALVFVGTLTFAEHSKKVEKKKEA